MNEVGTNPRTPLLNLARYWRASSKRGPTVCAGIFALAAMVYWAIVAQRSALFADDYVNFAIARRSGLTWSYLSESVFGHFIPGVRLVDYLLALGHPISHGLVVGIEVVLLAVFLFSFYRLVVLFGSNSYLSVLIFGIGVSSALLVPVVVWWSTSIEMVGGAAFGTLATYAALRWSATRRTYLIVISALSYTCAIAMNDGALIFLGFVVLVDVFAGASPWNLKNALYALRRRGWAYSAFVVPTVIDLTWRVTHTSSYRSAAPASFGTTLHFATVAFSESLLPGYFDISSREISDPSIRIAVAIVATGALIAIFAASWWRDHTRWRAACIAVIPIFLGDLITGRARASVFGANLGLDFRYQTANLVFLAVGLVMATAPRQVQISSPQHEQSNDPACSMPHFSRSTQRLGAIFSLVLAVGYVPHFIATQDVLSSNFDYQLANAAKSYVTNFAASWKAIERQANHESIFDVQAGGIDLLPGFAPYALLSNSISLVVPSVVFNTTADLGYIPDQSGRLIAARYSIVASSRTHTTRSTNTTSCRKWRVRSGAWKMVVRLDHTVRAGSWLIRIAYRDTSPSSATVFGSGKVQFDPNHHQVFAPIMTNRLGAIELVSLHKSSICVGAIDVGAAMPLSSNQK